MTFLKLHAASTGTEYYVSPRNIARFFRATSGVTKVCLFELDEDGGGHVIDVVESPEVLAQLLKGIK